MIIDLRFGRVVSLMVASLAMLVTTAQADLFINEIDYDQSGTDSAEWLEIVGTAGTSLNDYELIFINGSNGSPYATYDLALANFTFSDESNGWGFFVFGESTVLGVEEDHQPSGWGENEIQNGGPDSIRLSLKSGSVDIHTVEYEGNDLTLDGQATSLADSTSASSSLYLTGFGNSPEDFDFANATGNATPGSLNFGQVISAVPEPTAFLFGSLVAGSVGMVVARRRPAREPLTDAA